MISFSSSMATLIFQRNLILQASMSIPSPSTCFFLVFFHSYLVLVSFIVRCLICASVFLFVFVMIFFLYFFCLPLVLGHHGVSHNTIVFASFIMLDVYTYFYPFFFSLLAFPLLFQVSFLILKIFLLFHVYKFFGYIFLLQIFLCRFFCL
jgi:hypothetical protein